MRSVQPPRLSKNRQISATACERRFNRCRRLRRLHLAWLFPRAPLSVLDSSIGFVSRSKSKSGVAAHAPHLQIFLARSVHCPVNCLIRIRFISMVA